MIDIEQHILQLLELSDSTTAAKITALIAETREALADYVAAMLSSTDVNRAAVAHANFRLEDALSTRIKNRNTEMIGRVYRTAAGKWFYAETVVRSGQQREQYVFTCRIPEGDSE